MMILLLIILASCADQKQPWEQRMAKPAIAKKAIQQTINETQNETENQTAQDANIANTQQDALAMTQTDPGGQRPNKAVTIVLEKGTQQEFSGYTLLFKNATTSSIELEFNGELLTLAPGKPQQYQGQSIMAQFTDATQTKIKLEIREY